ncbi:hypothetical protein HHX47_DHR2000562 [Lentinula edodes]|nr:hypothetical protein HHX47_DHR2000562 [Lentinula edodes]
MQLIGAHLSTHYTSPTLLSHNFNISCVNYPKPVSTVYFSSMALNAPLSNEVDMSSIENQTIISTPKL